MTQSKSDIIKDVAEKLGLEVVDLPLDPKVRTRPYETWAMAELRKTLTKEGDFTTEQFEAFKACLTHLEVHHDFSLVKHFTQGE